MCKYFPHGRKTQGTVFPFVRRMDHNNPDMIQFMSGLYFTAAGAVIVFQTVPLFLSYPPARNMINPHAISGTLLRS